MRKPIEQKPPLAAWATVARDEAGMSVEEVVDALQARGHAVTAATLRGIEGGSKGASVRLRRLLSAIYDKPVPGDAPLVPAGQDAVAAAIDRQTEELVKAIQARDTVIEELLQELATYRKQTIERQTTEQSLIAALPGALSTALARALDAMRSGDPADEPHEVRPGR